MYLLLLMIATYIAILLFGILLMRIGFESLSISKLKQYQPNPSLLTGFIIGFMFTLILQSSSVSIALLVSFYSAYRLSIPFAICFILGANIGTTLTAQLFMWNNEHLMLAFLLIGLLFLLIRIRKFFFLGAILFGVGIIFSALGGLENLSQQIPSHTYTSLQNGQISHPMSLGAFGMAITAIIQSSTALTGMLMTFTSAGSIPLLDSYYLLLGANIGTCLTVFIVALSHSKKVRVIAYTHLWVNLLGGLFFFHPKFGQAMVDLTNYFVNDPSQQIVVLSFLFNLFVAMLFVIFLKPFTRFLEKVHGTNTIV